MLESVFKTETFEQSAISTTGTVLNGFLGAVFYIFLARFLGPSDFGLMTVSIATLTMIADIVDLGTNTGLVRHVSAHLNSEKEKAFRFLKLGLEFKVLIWLLVLLIGFLAAPFIAENIFGKTVLTTPLRLVMVGVGGASLFSFATSALQSFQRYFIWSLVNISANALRLILILVLFSAGSLNLSSGLITYIAMPFFGFSVALLFLPIGKIITVRNETSVAGHFFRYNFWVAAFTIIAAVSARLDTFISARLLSSFQIGLYGVATQLVSVVPQLDGALGVVAAPKFASFQNDQQMLTYFKKLQLLVFGLAFLGIIILPLAVYLIPIIFGQQYAQAIPAFIFLSLAMLVFLISLPVHNSIIYYFGKPDIFVWVSIGHLLIIGIVGYFLILNFGIIGAAVTVLSGMLFNLLIPLGWFLLRIRK